MYLDPTKYSFEAISLGGLDLNALRKRIHELLPKKERQAIVYLWTNLLTKEQYIGSGKFGNPRLLDYLTPSLVVVSYRIGSALINTGYDKFSLHFKIVSDHNAALKLEQYFLDKYR